MHEDETVLCPFPDRRDAARRLGTLCTVLVGPELRIRTRAAALQQEAGVSPKDALHLACALHAAASAFVTCDDRLLRQARRRELDIATLSPVDYVLRERP